MARLPRVGPVDGVEHARERADNHQAQRGKADAYDADVHLDGRPTGYLKVVPRRVDGVGAKVDEQLEPQDADDGDAVRSARVTAWSGCATHKAPVQNMMLAPAFLRQLSRSCLSCEMGMASIQTSSAMLMAALDHAMALMLMQRP